VFCEKKKEEEKVLTPAEPQKAAVNASLLKLTLLALLGQK
jgi:hypothetical protein